MERTTAWWLLVPLAFTAVWLLTWRLLRRRGAPFLRGIAAFDTLQDAVASAAEEGRPLHLSLGTGGLADAHALETVAALHALDYVAQAAAATRNTPLVTTGNATSLPAAQEIMSKPFASRDALAQFDTLAVRFSGGGTQESGAAAMAAVMDLIERREPAANVMLGHFGDEALLAGEAGGRAQLVQVAGAANPSALPPMALFADRLLMGEELYAAGAYLSRLPAHIASLATQDLARWVLIGTVLALTVARTLGIL